MNNKRKIRHDLWLPLSDGICRGTFFDCVKAEIVDIAPHLAVCASFAIFEERKGKYNISNIETGTCLSVYRTDKATAIKIAKKFLSKITINKLKNTWSYSTATERNYEN